MKVFVHALPDFLRNAASRASLLLRRHPPEASAPIADSSSRRKETRLQKARIRCREIRDYRYCPGCHLAFEKIHPFCDGCSNATEHLPSDYALDYARAEFPDLVASREDFDRLLE